MFTNFNVYLLRGVIQLGKLRLANPGSKDFMTAKEIFHTYVKLLYYFVRLVIQVVKLIPVYVNKIIKPQFSWAALANLVGLALTFRTYYWDLSNQKYGFQI